METAEELKEVIDQLNRTLDIVGKRKQRDDTYYAQGYEAGINHVCSLLRLDITVLETKLKLFYSGVNQD